MGDVQTASLANKAINRATHVTLFSQKTSYLLCNNFII